MKCPACDRLIQNSVPACPECGFTLASLKSTFGTIPRHDLYVTDYTYGTAITKRQTTKLIQLLEFFEKRFPESRFSILLTPFFPEESIRKYTFYLMNNGRFSSLENKEGFNSSLLLLINTESLEACLMVGYGLEPWITEGELEIVLNKIREPLAQRRFYEAATGCVKATISFLKEKTQKTFP